MSELLDALQEEANRLREELAAAEREQDRLMLLADPFRVEHWPFDYQWRTVDADGAIIFHKEMPELIGGGIWFSDGHMDNPGRMNLKGLDHRNSLRARPADWPELARRWAEERGEVGL